MSNLRPIRPTPDEARRPPGRRAVTPFACVALLAQVTLGWPLRPTQHPRAAALALVLLALLAGWAVIGHLWGRRTRLVAAVGPFVFLGVVALWRDADGGSRSALTAMVGLSVLWLALHGSLRLVWASVAGVAVVLGAPLLVVHGGAYPLDDAARAVLWTAFASLLGPLTHAVVAQREAVARRVLALEPSDSRFRGLLEAATEHAVIATDRRGVITVFNTGAERLLGFDEAVVIGRLPLIELFVVRELGHRAEELGIATGLEVLVHAARAGGSETRDWTWVTQDGERRTVALSLSAVHARDERLSGYIAIARDVTDSRRARAEMAAQEELVRLVLDHLPDTLVGLLDADLHWVWIGGSYLTSRDIAPASFVGQRLGTMSASIGYPDAIDDFMRAGLTGAGRQEFETGSGAWFEIDAVPMAGPGGQALVLAVCRVVTERHTADAERAEMVAALAASEEGFRTTFESAPVGIALTTVDQGPGSRILQGNAALARMLGRTVEELEELPLAAITHPDETAARPPVHAGVAVSTTTRLVHASGRSIRVGVRAVLIDDPRGRPAYVLVHVVDETARHDSDQALYRALEQQREAAEVLEQTDALRTETMSTISHELRTPLTSIEGYLELIADGVAGPLVEEQSRMLEVVRRNAARLRALVDDLLVLSRLDDRTHAPEGAPVDLGAVCRGVLETLGPLARARDQLVEHRVDPGPHVVLGDAEQLDRVLMNLVANAIKYTPDGGRITLALERVEGEVRVVVTDTGIGIPADEQERLFERFFRARTAQRRGIEGTGLGLAIAQSIVERHHGRIETTSQEGVGSTFVVAVPARPPQPALAGARLS